jgi:hypothetical protein
MVSNAKVRLFSSMGLVNNVMCHHGKVLEAILDLFAPSRGLQVDLLSPFIFLFVADGSSAMLHEGVVSKP